MKELFELAMTKIPEKSELEIIQDQLNEIEKKLDRITDYFEWLEDEEEDISTDYNIYVSTINDINTYYETYDRIPSRIELCHDRYWDLVKYIKESFVSTNEHDEDWSTFDLYFRGKPIPVTNIGNVPFTSRII